MLFMENIENFVVVIFKFGEDYIKIKSMVIFENYVEENSIKVKEERCFL